MCTILCVTQGHFLTSFSSTLNQIKNNPCTLFKGLPLQFCGQYIPCQTSIICVNSKIRDYYYHFQRLLLTLYTHGCPSSGGFKRLVLLFSNSHLTPEAISFSPPTQEHNLLIPRTKETSYSNLYLVNHNTAYCY